MSSTYFLLSAVDITWFYVHRGGTLHYNRLLHSNLEWELGTDPIEWIPFFHLKRGTDPVCKKVYLTPELAVKAQRGEHSSTLPLNSGLDVGVLWTPRLDNSTPRKRLVTYSTEAWMGIKAIEKVKSYRNDRWIVILLEARRTGRRNFVKWTEEIFTHFLAQISFLYIGVVISLTKSKPTPTRHPSNKKYVTFYRLK